jgi:ribosomal protein L37AE/L43A
VCLRLVSIKPGKKSKQPAARVNLSPAHIPNGDEHGQSYPAAFTTIVAYQSRRPGCDVAGRANERRKGLGVWAGCRGCRGQEHRLSLFTSVPVSQQLRRGFLTPPPKYNCSYAHPGEFILPTHLPLPNRQTGAAQRTIGPDGSTLAFQAGHVTPHAHLPSLSRATYKHKTSVRRATAVTSLRLPATRGIAPAHTPTERLRCIRPRTRRHVRDARG